MEKILQKKQAKKQQHNISFSREAEVLCYIPLYQTLISRPQALHCWLQAVTRDMAEATLTAANLNLTQRTSGRKVTPLI